ncbi:MAG: helix-turn-helix domain-containing protein, partial [Burkholderiaceae bacterium]
MEFIKPSSKTNRSLMRGMEILRCFKPGMSLLGNSEIAERTGLPPSTISR